MKAYPRSRAMGETVREIIARLLLEEVSDPRLDLVTVTGVVMSPDLGHANVFVTVHGDEVREAEAIAGLDSAKGRLRSMLGAEIRLRKVPELHFRIDPAIGEATRITDAIRREHELGRAGSEDVIADGDDAAGEGPAGA
jgi:ribosome-binding factor A